jgi:hypothetical protein
VNLRKDHSRSLSEFVEIVRSSYVSCCSNHILSGGCFGSHIDEGRSIMRYPVRIAEECELTRYLNACGTWDASPRVRSVQCNL